MTLVLSVACTLAAHDYYFMHLPAIYLLSALSHIPYVLISAPIHVPTTCTLGLDPCARHSLFGRTDPYYIDNFYSSSGLQRLAATLVFPLLYNCTVLPVPLSTGPYLDSSSPMPLGITPSIGYAGAPAATGTSSAARLGPASSSACFL